jgi:hypothetical protein
LNNHPGSKPVVPPALGWDVKIATTTPAIKTKPKITNIKFTCFLAKTMEANRVTNDNPKKTITTIAVVLKTNLASTPLWILASQRPMVAVPVELKDRVLSNPIIAANKKATNTKI